MDDMIEQFKEAGEFTPDDMRWMEYVRSEGLMERGGHKYRLELNYDPKPYVASPHLTWRQNYQEYLLSAAWDRTRGIAIIEARNCCQRCGWRADYKGTGLEVHHKTYVRLFNELPEDLEVLCKPCHEIADQERAEKNKRGRT